MDDVRINKAVGAELRAARARRGWSREELSKRSGVTVISMRRYEAGTRSVPVDALAYLMSALDLDVADIDRAIKRAALESAGEPEPHLAEPGRNKAAVGTRIARAANARQRGKN